MQKISPKLAGLIAIFVPLVASKAAGANATNMALNRAAYHSSAINHDNVAHLATDGSGETFWQSKPEDQPWIYVDLGALRKLTGVRLMWAELAPAGCAIQVATEAGPTFHWIDVAHLACAGSQTSSASFAATEARFVRMLADKGTASSGCQLKEFIVDGSPVPETPPADLHLPPPDEEGKMPLDGAGWKLQNTLFLHETTGEAISGRSFPVEAWLPAKVPGTVLHSYLLAGAVPDPDFGDQQNLVSESFFQNDFWYRREFAATVDFCGAAFSAEFLGHQLESGSLSERQPTRPNRRCLPARAVRRDGQTAGRREKRAGGVDPQMR